nr:hypothetical protein Itr_chr14CG24440 [Ipomoea trifida]
MGYITLDWTCCAAKDINLDWTGYESGAFLIFNSDLLTMKMACKPELVMQSLQHQFNIFLPQFFRLWQLGLQALQTKSILIKLKF